MESRLQGALESLFWSSYRLWARGVPGVPRLPSSLLIVWPGHLPASGMSLGEAWHPARGQAMCERL